MSRTKVLVLCTNSDEAGAPIHVRTLISALADQIEFLAVFGEDGPIAERLKAQGVAVEIVPEMRSRISPFQDTLAFRAIARHAARFAPQVVHAHSSKAGMLGRLLTLQQGIPCVYTVHGWGWRGLNPVAAWLVFLLERLLSRVQCSSYVYVSRSVAREAQARLRVSSAQGRVIYNGVEDHGRGEEPTGRLRILMPARITAAKDHETLVRAFELLPFDAELVLCGTGTDSHEFRRRLQEWAPTRHSLIQGLGPRSDVHRLLCESHIFVLISHFEALPLSVIEAMSAGRAIVASDVGGVSELVTNDVDGYLVGRKDIQAVVRALSSLRDAELRTRLAAAARARYEAHFTADAMSTALIEAYRDAAISRKSHRSRRQDC